MSLATQPAASPTPSLSGSPFQLPPRRRRIAVAEASRGPDRQAERLLGILVVLAGLIGTLGAVFLAG